MTCLTTNPRLATISIDPLLVALVETTHYQDLPNKNTLNLNHPIDDLPHTIRNKVMRKFPMKTSCDLSKMRRLNE